MNKDRKLTLLILANVFGFAAALCTVFSPKMGLINTKATSSYALHLDQTTHFETGLVASGNQTKNAHTDLGNPVGFTYSGLYALDNGFQSVAPNGYLANTLAISGIDSMTITLAEGSAPLTLSYGWAYDLYNVLDVTISSSSSYFFDGSGPSFITLKNTAASDPLLITSLEVAFSCSATSNPYVVQGVTYYKDAGVLGAVSYSGARTSVELQDAILGTPLRVVAPNL